MLASVNHDGRFRQTTGSELRLLQNRQATRLTTQVDAAPSPVHAGITSQWLLAPPTRCLMALLCGRNRARELRAFAELVGGSVRCAGRGRVARANVSRLIFDLAWKRPSDSRDGDRGGGRHEESCAVGVQHLVSREIGGEAAGGGQNGNGQCSRDPRHR